METVQEKISKKLKKPGRPRQEIRRDIRAAVRFTHHEYYIIRQKAAQAGINISTYLRQTAIAGRISPRLSGEELQIVRQLIGMSVNLNQVAHTCHREGLLAAMQYFEQYRNQLDQLLEKLRS